MLAESIGLRSQLVRVPPHAGTPLMWLGGPRMRDLALTRDKVNGLMDRLLTSVKAPYGVTRLSHWLEESSDILGRNYVSELRRNWR